MSSRGRVKVGLRRIDAAIDALVPLGFSKDVVRRTVLKLLKIYEGDAGWVFIEEASYKLVIETILEEQEQKQKQKKEKEKKCGQGEAIQWLSSLHIKEQQHGGFDIGEGSTSACLDSGPSNLQQQQQQQSVYPISAGATKSNPSNLQLQILPGTQPRRKPTYGWISESEDDEDDEE